jgi:ketosteroid isomerase-like protein
VGKAEASGRELAVVVEAYNAAWNAHDLDAVMSFYTEDIVVSVRTPASADTGEPSPFNVAGAGKQQVRDMVKGFLPGYHLEYWDVQVSGNGATLHYRNSADALQNIGVDFLEATAEVGFEGKKIKHFYSIWSPETTQKVWDALGGGSS